jgi:hypothetical protein
MKGTWLLCLLIVVSIAPSSYGAGPQDDERRDLRYVDDWKKGRATARPHRKKAGKASNSKGATAANVASGGTSPLALGFTVYKANERDEPVQVDSSQRLKDGDRIRFVFEANTEGYLYVFDTDDRGSPPVMIFPDASLRGGENRILPHVACEVPSSADPDPRLRWLVLDHGPLTERVVFVLTREPLPGVPAGKELVSFCRKFTDACPWQPPAVVWTAIAAEVNEGTWEVRQVSPGAPPSRGELDSVRRSLRLRKQDPAPSVVRTMKAVDTPQLVTLVELVH